LNNNTQTETEPRKSTRKRGLPDRHQECEIGNITFLAESELAKLEDALKDSK